MARDRLAALFFFFFDGHLLLTTVGKVEAIRRSFSEGVEHNLAHQW